MTDPNGLPAWLNRTGLLLAQGIALTLLTAHVALGLLAAWWVFHG